MIDQQWISSAFLFVAIGAALTNLFLVKGGIVIKIERRTEESKLANPITFIKYAALIIWLADNLLKYFKQGGIS